MFDTRKSTITSQLLLTFSDKDKFFGKSQSPIVSFSRIEELVNNVVNNGNIRQSNEMRHLETHIIDAFSSPACLNASFLKNKNHNI